MEKRMIYLVLPFIIGYFSPAPYMRAQNYSSLVTVESQKEILSYLAADDARGRASGSMMNRVMADYIRELFTDYGLEPYMDGSYFQQFRMDDGSMGRNVIAMLTPRRKSSKYIVISAHYDHIGSLNGYVYNGADDNASGVTVLLGLAKMFSNLRSRGFGLEHNIIFAAFDAKEEDMRGSREFLNRLPFSKKDIILNVNIDQIGSTLEPVHPGRKDYVIMLGSQTLKQEDRDNVKEANLIHKIGLDVDYTFYGSPRFADYYFKVSDQASFTAAGIPSVLFTSGFHQNTYKTTDDVDTIDFEVMRKRMMLIFYSIFLF